MSMAEPEYKEYLTVQVMSAALGTVSSAGSPFCLLTSYSERKTTRGSAEALEAWGARERR